MAETKVKGRMKVLMVMNYKGHPIYVRQFDKDMFVWDVIIDNQLFSSYLVMLPAKGKMRLNKAELDETVKMCYAGAAATVDMHLGIELNDKDEDVVARFEAARKQVEGPKMEG